MEHRDFGATALRAAVIAEGGNIRGAPGGASATEIYGGTKIRSRCSVGDTASSDEHDRAIGSVSAADSHPAGCGEFALLCDRGASKGARFRSIVFSGGRPRNV